MKLKNFEELRQKLVLALKAKLSATSSSPPPILSKEIQLMTVVVHVLRSPAISMRDSSSLLAKENDTCPSNDMAGVVVSAMGKAKVGLVALQLQSAADHDVSVLGRFGSSCIAKEMDGNVLSSSFFFAKENDASLLGKMVARASFTKVGVAPLLLPTAASLSSNGSSSSLSLAKRIGGNVLSFLPPLLR
ncbi:hypothetical protein OIU78_028531 [Salix suchowensis]|nr:hypothetical protein OIU78_028531 [Salix suchowensis]